MSESLLVDRPRIVADFEYVGYHWLVVDWPATAENPEGDWQVYRADLPWSWRSDALDMR